MNCVQQEGRAYEVMSKVHMRAGKGAIPFRKKPEKTLTLPPIQVQVFIANWSACLTGGRSNPTLATNKYHVKIHYLTQPLKLADRLIHIASEISSCSYLGTLNEVRRAQ